MAKVSWKVKKLTTQGCVEKVRTVIPRNMNRALELLTHTLWIDNWKQMISMYVSTMKRLIIYPLQKKPSMDTQHDGLEVVTPFKHGVILGI